ncbi:Harbinger transposase-derived nuclease domain [Arabidopsis suecica]|uniref:Harbinger transposase-derived nuclease domain n=1 Tax=Arabidopsis suecica TaxID=45249 RepID=A0A8T2BMP7_ARASU|nr:Harbinger transposase-derived nuclease domain [Arabidopsis suecica]
MSWSDQECYELTAILVDAIKRDWRDKNAPDDVWAAYLMGHPNHHHMRTSTFEDFEDLQLIFESAIAKGNNAFGLGGDSNAETFEEEEDLQARDDVNHMEINDEVNETLPKEKLPTRKRSKTNCNGDASDSINNGESSEKVLSEMIGVGTNIINLIHLREERHQREVEFRETQKNKNNVWNAIKEIPDLEDHIRYDAVTKIHALNLRDVFLLMDDDIHEEVEDTSMNIERIEDDDIDTSISLVVVMMTVAARIHNTRRHLMGDDYIERPIRRSVTKLGEQYIQKNCVGAIDGTHIPATVVGRETSSYRNRKGTISQNVLAVCNFDLEFIYVLSGWEGSAHDSRVLSDALTRRTNNFQVPEGKFYLVDCGFANRLNFLAPFRGVRYHLQEFAGQGRDPETPHELFNLRHASLRNVIERIFGIFKSRFAIFKSAPPFSYTKQAGLVLACAALHNFLRKECRSDEADFPDEVENEGDAVNNEGNAMNTNEIDSEEPLETQEQDRENANMWRKSMAEDMWKDATNLEIH